MGEPKSHIMIHDEGAGAASPDEVKQRARELAAIAGRAPNEFTEEDFLQARAELTGSPELAETDAPEEAITFEPGSGDILGGRPHHAENLHPEDESTVGEELFTEGTDEALHDEMLEAAKKNLRDAS
jgi:hypothetical protein